ncbi:MAG: TPM domain-containing protein [Candidatus Cloacimonetes bacterium]|nr:TPM domain-containing protein [Candidatus Cloacimonadota bacterium]
MKKIILISILFVFSASALFSLDIPKLKGAVNDYANIINSKDEEKLEALLRDVEAKTSSQVALLTISSLQGENLEDYSLRVAQEWKLGQKEFDNGVLLLVAFNEKKIRIEVGYGLEAIITDSKSGYIIRNYIVPDFKQGNYTVGIANGLLAISGLVTKEFEITDEQLAKYNQQQKAGKLKQIPFGLIVFLFMFIFGGLGRGRRRGGLFTALFLGSMLGGGRSGNNSGFGGGFGGFSGGGGSFGGGGASGGW